VDERAAAHVIDLAYLSKLFQNCLRGVQVTGYGSVDCKERPGQNSKGVSWSFYPHVICSGSRINYERGNRNPELDRAYENLLPEYQL